jgi:hypothetical protein
MLQRPSSNQFDKCTPFHVSTLPSVFFNEEKTAYSPFVFLWLPEIRSALKLLHLQGSVASLQVREWCAGVAYFNPDLQLSIPPRTPLPDKGRIVEIRRVGGPHHRYERRAA